MAEKPNLDKCKDCQHYPECRPCNTSLLEQLHEVRRLAIDTSQDELFQKIDSVIKNYAYKRYAPVDLSPENIGW